MRTKLLVLGGTGRLGRLVLREGLERGHHITALVRTPRKLAGAPARLRVVPGDALDRTAVAAALVNQDAVISVLGAGFVRTTMLFSQSMQVLLEAMQARGVRRLLCVTGVGAGDTKGHGGFLYDRVLYPLFTRNIYRDKDRQEALIRESATDWTIVRPAVFQERTPPGPLRIVTQVDGLVLRRVLPLEVAVFLLEELQQNRYVRQAVFMGHE